MRREGGDGDAGAVTVEFQSVVEGERPINYRGTYVGAKRDVPSSSARDVGVECALVFDPATGEFTVEKIGGAVKSLRVSRDARGDDAGVGVGVNEDANKTVEKAKKKPRKQDPKEAAAMEQAAAAVAKATEARRAEAKATETAVGPFARVRLRERGVGPGVGVGVGAARNTEGGARGDRGRRASEHT